LAEFIPLAQARGDEHSAHKFRQHAAQLRRALENSGWDGQWYRRAYFDDGTPLGSAQNDECQIDSLAQTWSVLAGADSSRARQAIQSVLERLVHRDERLVLLFAPPFDKTALDPGYIKGYLPGIRENGGQYTHAALWLVEALAQLGDGDQAMAIYDLIDPTGHAEVPEGAARYQVEPYVVAADVYGAAPHTGRGGWTWYTGSAAWMYRVAVESLLGLKLQGNKLEIRPCLPADWPGFELTFRRGTTTWKFNVVRDDARQPDANGSAVSEIDLVDDGGVHEITIRYPAAKDWAPRESGPTPHHARRAEGRRTAY
jgi:cyclic beta-1,2-glucan synthetase